MRVNAGRRGGGTEGLRSSAGRGADVGGNGLLLADEIYVLSVADFEGAGQGVGEAGSFGNC
jgi:hypothetical protein